MEATHTKVKGNNKRIIVTYFHENKSFIVATKTLIDRKERRILTTENIYSVETFFVIHELMGSFLNDSSFFNKHLHKEVAKINEFKSY